MVAGYQRNAAARADLMINGGNEMASFSDKHGTRQKAFRGPYVLSVVCDNY